MDIFNKRLKELRGKKSKEEIANAIGITPQSLGRYEGGHRKPDIEILKKMAEYFKVSADYLLGISETKIVNENVAATQITTGLSEENVLTLHEFAKERKRNLNKCEYTSIDSINTILEAFFKNPNALRQITNILNIDYDLYEMCSTSELQNEVNEFNQGLHKVIALSYPEYLQFCENTAKNEMSKIIDTIINEHFGDLKEAPDNAQHNPPKE